MDGASWPDWAGQTVVCIATGPSLKVEQLDCVRAAGARTIAVNDAGLEQRLPVAAPWADMLYAADRVWWDHYRPRFGGLKVSCEQPDRRKIDGVDLVVRLQYGAPSYEPGLVHNAGFSGHQAMQIPISLGARRVVLVGYDCKANGSRTNYFGRKAPEVEKPSPYADWVKAFAALPIPASVEIVNCTPGSAISCYPFRDLAAALCS